MHRGPKDCDTFTSQWHNLGAVWAAVGNGECPGESTDRARRKHHLDRAGHTRPYARPTIIRLSEMRCCCHTADVQRATPHIGESEAQGLGARLVVQGVLVFDVTVIQFRRDKLDGTIRQCDGGDSRLGMIRDRSRRDIHSRNWRHSGGRSVDRSDTTIRTCRRKRAAGWRAGSASLNGGPGYALPCRIIVHISCELLCGIHGYQCRRWHNRNADGRYRYLHRARLRGIGCGFRLADYQREAVDPQDDVEPPRILPTAVRHFIGDDQLVLLWVLEVDKPHSVACDGSVWASIFNLNPVNQHPVKPTFRTSPAEYPRITGGMRDQPL